jgi:hypothetical protein
MAACLRRGCWLLGCWVPIPLKSWLFVLAFLCCVVLLGRGLAKDWRVVQGVPPNVDKTCLRNLTYVRRHRFSKNRAATGKERIRVSNRLNSLLRLSYLLICWVLYPTIIHTMWRSNVKWMLQSTRLLKLRRSSQNQVNEVCQRNCEVNITVLSYTYHLTINMAWLSL